MIRIGIIGCGGISEPHANGYLKIPEQARVVAVSDIVPENAQRRAEQVGGARIFDDYHALLRDGEVDAVDICLPHHLHKDAIVAAANAGKQILCEKPLCLTLVEADAVQRAVRENGVTLMCAHNQLYMPAVARTKQLLGEGMLGQLYEVRTTDAFRHPWSDPGMTWRSRRDQVGGGELIDTGYHPTYLLLYLAGAEPVEVTALLSRHRLPLEGEDSAQVLARFANDAVGHIVTSWAYDSAPGMWKFTVIGERGYLYAEGETLRYQVRGEQEVTESFPGVDTFAAEIADFVACVQERRRPLQTEIEGTNALKVILGAYTSADEKRTVTL